VTAVGTLLQLDAAGAELARLLLRLVSAVDAVGREAAFLGPASAVRVSRSLPN
jgi:hypothetical protein